MMSLNTRKKRADSNPEFGNNPLSRIRLACAKWLQPYSTHAAGGGSYYVFAGDIKIRFADHDNISSYYDQPDYNLQYEADLLEVDESDDDRTQLDEVIDDIEIQGYPELVKKTVMAKHLGLTLPKLKTMLEPHAATAYEDVCLNEAYPTTLTQLVCVEETLRIAQEAGITIRIPVAYGSESVEDYDGRSNR